MTETQTIAGNASMPNPTNSDTTMVGNTGAGYARITSLTKPIGEISYSPNTATTGNVVVTVGTTTGGVQIHFTTPGWASTDGGVTYTKSYSENFTGEVISFTDDEGNREVQEIAVTRIMPEVTITYNPEGPTLITGNVVSTISFNGRN